MRVVHSFTIQRAFVYASAFIVLAAGVMSISVLIQSIQLAYFNTIGKTAVVCGCEITNTSIHPALLTVAIIISTSMIALAVRMLILLAYTFFKTQKTIRSWEVASSRLMMFEGRIFTFTVVKLDTPLLCSAGIFDNAIYISTHTLNTLSTQELLAATLHELGHLKHHHPLHFQLFSALTRSLFISRTSPLNSYHAFAHEHTADLYALRFVQRGALLSAITHFFSSTPTVALPHFSLEESRIKLLLGYAAPQAPRTLNFTVIAILVASIATFLPLTLFARTESIAELKDHNNQRCAYVEPPQHTFICMQSLGQTLFLYQTQ
ncbi:MAG: hypothetical protein KIH62_001920 [Candidatus Kerfeldbacteria bacterium]|nr:hypothetical protein [Candidatus Kerfeldbacteria bacterium]